MAVLVTESGREFTATPNHPMLTARGWRPASDIEEGEYLICRRRQENSRSSSDEDVTDPPATIAEVFEAASAVGVVERRTGGEPDFHGDGREGQVDIARPGRELPLGRFAALSERSVQEFFAPTDVSARTLFCAGCGTLLAVDKETCLCGSSRGDSRLSKYPSDQGVGEIEGAADRLHPGAVLKPADDVGGVDIVPPGGRMPAASEELGAGIPERSSRDPRGSQPIEDRTFIRSDTLSDLGGADPGHVEGDRVVARRLVSYAGYVFNLCTPYGYFTANGVYTGNTELVGAVNGGSLAATQLVASATGSSYLKAWMTAPGAPHPRHELYDGLDGQTVALDEKFDVGGSALSYPGDPDGDPGETVNCRCSLRYVEGDGEQGAAGDDTAAADAGTDGAPPVEPPPPLSGGEPPVGGGEPYAADIGVTPFRAGEDQAVGFYESDKYGQFVGDVHDSASSYGVTVDGLDRVTGVWQGDTEPSVSLRIHDGEKGVRAYAANLGNAYHQDGVLIFGDHPAGDVMATFQNALPQDRLTEAMAKAGIDGGRFTADGRLQVIGSGPDFVKQLDALAGDIGPYDASAGRFELLERDSGDYGRAIQAFGPPNSKAVRNTFDEPTQWGEEPPPTT